MAKFVRPQIELNSREQEVLQTLSRRGAMPPGQLAAETLLVPTELNRLLDGLASFKLVIVREDNTPDGRVVILTGEGKEALGQIMTAQYKSSV